MSLQVDAEVPQAFFAGFELAGQADRGQLTLTSPLGSTLGTLRWSPDEATLQSGAELTRFDSLETLITRTTGAQVPVDALFDWLKGANTSKPGWSADLTRLNSGRIDAVRTDPLPVTRLRIVLDQ